MKKWSLILGISFFAMACSNNRSKSEMPITSQQQEKTDANIPKPNAKIDPVCGMPEGKIAYTDFSIYNKDTVWFCSPHCKGQFDKNPEKYAKKL